MASPFQAVLDAIKTGVEETTSTIAKGFRSTTKAAESMVDQEREIVHTISHPNPVLALRQKYLKRLSKLRAAEKDFTPGGYHIHSHVEVSKRGYDEKTLDREMAKRLQQ